MNKINTLIAVALFFSCISTYGQVADQTFFSKSDRIEKFHTINDLEDLGKGELVDLYADRFSELIKTMPFMAITTKSDQKLDDFGIRASASNLKLLSKYKTEEREHIKASDEIISDFIAYADTDNIVWSILYMEDIIKKLRLGFKGNF
ncbi:hypothetical protein [Tamlana sp. I1]|uniref:hypothetical protein n=1 Tax=Tamlana sp. I1 TaxID=2762061 RepID=UPI00188E32E0|nr:hypothetical protein [Tamlana sp. I1]